MAQNTIRFSLGAAVLTALLLTVSPLWSEEGPQRTLLLENQGEDILSCQILPSEGLMIDGSLDGNLLLEMYQLHRDRNIHLAPGAPLISRQGTEGLVVVGQFPPEEGKDSSPLVVTWIKPGSEAVGISLSPGDNPSVRLRAPWVAVERENLLDKGGWDGVLSSWNQRPLWKKIDLSTAEPFVLQNNEGGVIRQSEAPALTGDVHIKARVLTPAEIGFDLFLKSPGVADFWAVFHDDDNRGQRNLYTLQVDLQDSLQRIWLWERGKDEPVLAGRWGGNETEGWEMRVFLTVLSEEAVKGWIGGRWSMDLYQRMAGEEDSRRYITTLKGKDMILLERFSDTAGGGGA